MNWSKPGTWLALLLKIAVLAFSILTWLRAAGLEFTIQSGDHTHIESFLNWMTYPFVIGAFLAFWFTGTAGLLMGLTLIPAMISFHHVAVDADTLLALAQEFLLPFSVAACLLLLAALVEQRLICTTESD